MDNDAKKPRRSISLGGYRTEEMIENIKRFDYNSKMLLIKEYNKVIESVNSLLG